MASFAEKPILALDAVGEWDRWLETTDSTDGVRLRVRKKSSTAPGLTYDEALDVALCHGWIDGQIGALDADYTLQSFTPRRRNSPWSRRNVGHVERLVAAGLMRERGQAEVDRAKADGRWDAAYQQGGASVPDDLQRALDTDPQAARFFATLSAQNRWAIIFRLSQLKRAETRERNIAKYVAMLARGETIY